MAEEGYNGWTNYETWCVNLWIENEEPSYRHAQDLAKFASRQADPTNGLASSLKFWIENDYTPDLGASLAADLLGAALGEVDWHEIAEAMLENVEDLEESATSVEP